MEKCLKQVFSISVPVLRELVLPNTLEFPSFASVGTKNGQHSGAVVKSVTSQQEGFGVKASGPFFVELCGVCSPHACVSFPWVLRFPPHSKDTQIGLTGYSKLPISVNVSVHGCSILC